MLNLFIKDRDHVMQFMVLSMHLGLMSIQQLEFLKENQNSVMGLHLERQFWLEKQIWVLMM